MIKKLIIVVIGITLITPFVVTIFFLRGNNFLYIILADFCSLLLLAILLIVYLVIEDVKKKRLKIVITSTCIFICFIASYKFQLQTANYTFFKIRETEMNELVNEINAYGKIHTMTNQSLGLNQINNTEVENYEDAYSEIKIRRNVMDYTEYLKEFDIDVEKFESIKNHLLNLKIDKFEIIDDKIFLLTNFTDSQNGYVYSTDGTIPVRYIYGGEFEFQKITENWFYFKRD